VFFFLAGVFDVLYAGEQRLIVLATRVVFVGMVAAFHIVLRGSGTVPYLAVHTALLSAVLHAFTAQLLVPDLPASLYWSIAAFAVLVAPLAVNWSQSHSLAQWLIALGVVLLTIYAVPALELGVFLLDGGGFYLTALTFAILLPAGWIPLQERLEKRRVLAKASESITEQEQGDTVPTVELGSSQHAAISRFGLPFDEDPIHPASSHLDEHPITESKPEMSSEEASSVQSPDPNSPSTEEDQDSASTSADLFTASSLGMMALAVALYVLLQRTNAGKLYLAVAMLLFFAASTVYLRSGFGNGVVYNRHRNHGVCMVAHFVP